MQNTNQNILFTILHFNDCYDIQPNKKGKLGIVSFQAFLRKMKAKYPKNIVLFSGDCFSPSILTNIFQGKHMVKALNMLGIDVACYGNHEFDLESNKTEQLAESCNFPWLLGNIHFKGTQFVLGNGKPYLIKQVHGLKLGIFGVAGQDWLGILSQQYQNQLQYTDVAQHSHKMCNFLKDQQKCDMIIALTHMRVYQDQKLPLQEPTIDIILGGHDHIIMKQFINGIPTLKSGDNFKNLGVINVYAKQKNPNAQYKGRNFDFDIVIQQIPIATQGINKQLEAHVNRCMMKYSKSDHLIGYSSVPLQTRFAEIRTKETNYGDFLVDLARAYYDSQCCILNAGSIRSDMLLPAGQLRYSFVSNIINNVIVVKEVPGPILLQALEYSVSGLPGFPGSFLCVSGIRFTYDISKTPRVQQVFINNKPLDPNRKYTVATQLYVATGGDGFQMLKSCKMLVDPIAGIDTLRLILKFFKGTHKLKGRMKALQISKDIEKAQKPKDKKAEEETPDEVDLFPIHLLKLCRMVSTRTNRIQVLKNKFINNENGQKYLCISPVVDQRIKSLHP